MLSNAVYDEGVPTTGRTALGELLRGCELVGVDNFEKEGLEAARGDLRDELAGKTALASRF